MLVNTEAEVPSVREILISEFILLDTESSLEQFLGLLASDGHVACNIFSSANTEASDGEASLRDYRFLACEILDDFDSPGESIAALSHRAVEDELADGDLAHDVVLLVLLGLLFTHNNNNKEPNFLSKHL